MDKDKYKQYSKEMEIAKDIMLKKMLDVLGMDREEFLDMLDDINKKTLEEQEELKPRTKQDVDDEKFGMVLREIREFYGYTRKEAAEELGVSEYTLTNLENKGHDTTSEIFRKIIIKMWQEEKSKRESIPSSSNLHRIIDTYIYTNKESFRYLAKRAGLPYSYVGDIWRQQPDIKTGEEIIPNIYELIALADAMEMTVEELIEKAGYKEIYKCQKERE